MISSVLTTLTLVSNIVFVLGILVILFDTSVRSWVYGFLNQNILLVLFLLSLGATLGSLAYSNVIGFVPCELCWFQRILMYPQFIVLFMAWLKKDKNVILYLLPLSVIGACVSFYHSLVHWGIGTSLLACTANGGECGKVYVLAYNYITIPFMAFSMFVYLITISIIYLKSQNVRYSK